MTRETTATAVDDGPTASEPLAATPNEHVVTEKETVVDVPSGKEDAVDKDGAEAKKEEPKATFANFFRVLSFANRLDWTIMLLGSVAALGSGVALPLMQIVFGNLVGDFVNYFTPFSTTTKEQFLAAVSTNALYIVYLFIGKFALAYGSAFAFRMISVRVSANLRLTYMAALLAQPVSRLDAYSTGEATGAITTSTNIIQQGISDKFALLLQTFALIVAAYGISFRYSWALTLASGSAMLFVLLVYGAIVPPFVVRQHRVEREEEAAATLAGEAFAAIRTVMALGAAEDLTRRYERILEDARKLNARLAPLVAAQFSPAFFAIYCAYALTFWFGLKLFHDGAIANVNSVIVVFFSNLLIVTSLGTIANPIIGVSKAASAATGLLAIIDAPRPSHDGKKAPEVSSQEDIRFENVTFAYPSRPNVGVLKDFSASFAKGKTTAIVGPSGSGKSTIVALLERWYQLPESSIDEKSTSLDEKGDVAAAANEPNGNQNVICAGEISVGGHSLTSLDLKWWRSQIGLVSQEPFLFNDTIEKNIAYGLVGSQWQRADEAEKLSLIGSACAESFADEFIKKLPEGYKTKVGEGGIKLSGGQRQRIAIARSIIKKPPILILDEATSAIDVRGEGIVQAALDRVSKGRTTITIAHRLSTVKKADNIIVLRNGKTVEQGTHHSLLQDPDGVYYKLVHAQNLVTADETEADDLHRLQHVEQALERERSEAVDVSRISDEAERAYVKRGVLPTIWLFIRETRPVWPWYFVILACTMVCGASFAMQSWLFAKIIEVFTQTGQQLMDSANFWALIFFILAIIVAIFYAGLGWACNAIAVHVGYVYRFEYFNNFIAKPIAFYDAESNSSGSLSSRLSNDPRQVQELLGVNTGFPMISLFNVLGCVAIAFAFGWKLSIVGIFAVTPIIFAAAFFRVRFEVQYDEMNAKVFAESSQFAAEGIAAFRTVLALTLEDTIQARYRELLDEHVRAAFRKASYATLVFALSDSVVLLCMALTFWYGGQLLGSREYDLVAFFVIYTAIVQGGQDAGLFLGISSNVARAAAAGNRILSLRSTAKTTDTSSLDDGDDDSAGRPGDGGRDGARIEFRKVCFKYPSRDAPVFDHLSLTIERGQFAAFVGPSGCGKTSAVGLLEKFYDIQAGAILLDGVDIRTVPAAQHRAGLALVSQEPTLFTGTIRSNLLLGLDQKGDDGAPAATDAELERACRDAEIHDFIASLPDGYGTRLGGSGGSGSVALSGGQKQRLCVARALLRRPRVLLLDEATSSLDSQSERLVQAAVERVAAGRRVTVVAVAHRLATVQRADVIFVFGEGGTVVERGSHVELLRRRGVYWGMCMAQALDA